MQGIDVCFNQDNFSNMCLSLESGKMLKRMTEVPKFKITAPSSTSKLAINKLVQLLYIRQMCVYTLALLVHIITHMLKFFCIAPCMVHVCETQMSFTSAQDLPQQDSCCFTPQVITLYNVQVTDTQASWLNASIRQIIWCCLISQVCTMGAPHAMMTVVHVVSGDCVKKWLYMD